MAYNLMRISKYMKVTISLEDLSLEEFTNI